MDAIELTEDTHLHLLRGLVGEGHCEDVPETGGVLHHQPDILHGQGERLAASSGRLIDCQRFYHLRKISMSKSKPTSLYFLPLKPANTAKET